jgi:hypothetical protein
VAYLCLPANPHGALCLGKQRRHVVQVLATLYPDRLALDMNFLRVAGLVVKGPVLKRVSDHVLHMRMDILPEFMQNVPNARSHRAILPAVVGSA